MSLPTLNAEVMCPCEDDGYKVDLENEEDFVFEDGNNNQKLPEIYKSKSVKSRLVDITGSDCDAVLTGSGDISPLIAKIRDFGKAACKKKTAGELKLYSALIACTNWGVPVIAVMLMEALKMTVVTYDGLYGLIQGIVKWVGTTDSKTFLFSFTPFWGKRDGDMYKKIDGLLSSNLFKSKFGITLGMDKFEDTMARLLPGLDISKNSRKAIKVMEVVFKWG